MFKEITTFFDVKIRKNSLIMIDIDDTILKYEHLDKQWWKNTFNTHYEISKNYDVSDQYTLNLWKSEIHKSYPLHVDKSGIFDLFERAKYENCKIIFLTARCSTLKEITIKHLNELEIFIDDIYFTPNVEKGIILKKIKTEIYGKYLHTICIDDIDSNLESIYSNFNEESISLFKMVS